MASQLKLVKTDIVYLHYISTKCNLYLYIYNNIIYKGNTLFVFKFGTKEGESGALSFMWPVIVIAVS